MAIAGHPTNYVALYTIGREGPEVTLNDDIYKNANTDDVLSTSGETLTGVKTQCICRGGDIIRNKVDENDDALITIDYIDFRPDERNPPLPDTEDEDAAYKTF